MTAPPGMLYGAKAMLYQENTALASFLAAGAASQYGST